MLLYHKKTRTNNPKDIVKHKFRFKDKIKVKYVKKLLHQKKFKRAKILFVLLEIPYFIRYLLKRYPADGFFPPFDFLPGLEQKSQSSKKDKK